MKELAEPPKSKESLAKLRYSNEFGSLEFWCSGEQYEELEVLFASLEN